ncbi:MAG: hypothetical protein P8N49_02215 [Opitutales bacterium]|nr:hypothetical protein [Opitutales bacterium]
MKLISHLSAVGILCFFSSCASYQRNTAEFRNSWDQGDTIGALANLEKAGSTIKPGHDEELLWNLEMSSVARANQLPQMAELHLNEAKTLVDQNFGGGLIDPQQKGLGEYVGKFHDRNLLEIYRSLSALERKDSARVQSSFNELRFKREEARELNRKKIVDAEDKASNTENLKYKEVMESGEISVSDYVNTELCNKYAEFYNPFGDYLRLVLQNRMYDVGSSRNTKFDFGVSKSTLTSVLGRKNFLVKESPRRGDSATYIFMETGSAPYRQEKKIRLPLVLFYGGNPPGGVLYAPIAFPQLQYRDDYDSAFQVKSGGKGSPIRMEELVDFDAVISSEFKADFPAEMAKAMVQTVLAVASQAAIEAATKEQQEESVAVALFAAVAKVAAAESLTQADERGWYSVPKKVLVQKIPTPANGIVSVTSQSGQIIKAKINPNSHTNFVYLKSIRKGFPIKQLANFSIDSALASHGNEEDRSLALSQSF